VTLATASGVAWRDAALERTRAELELRLAELAGLNLMAPSGGGGCGKLLRPRLLLTFAAASGTPPPLERAAALGAAVELIHLATLHHDDVLDDSPHRRRADSARERFGNKVSILFGDALLAAALDVLLRAASRRMQFAVARAVTLTLRGEMAQHLGHRTLPVDETDCIRVAARKTGSLFALAARLGALLAASPEPTLAPAYRLGWRLGTAFQLIDDALDYAGDRVQLGKEPGADYRQGIATLPLVLAWRAASGPERGLLEAGFGANGSSDFGRIREIVLGPAGFEPSLRAARRQLALARACLAGLELDGLPPLLGDYFAVLEARIPPLPDGRPLSSPAG